ncbi:hypothetical protein F5Y16DRAFT_375890 [Xylariaceae sp. FL0255]|nr:hypothetical protein F5Y16DRAFT_375890 [Xylariaceae sp. FL0255]
MSTLLSPETLDSEHHETLRHALLDTVLPTDLALETFAQLIDGLPLCRVAWDRYEHRLHPDHPINHHNELCGGALQVAQSLRDQLDVNTLRFEAELLQSYQNSAPGSRRFQLRLLELIAVALHQIAVYLFERDDERLHNKGSPSRYPHHTVDQVTSWRKPPGLFLNIEPWPTLFAHPAFAASEQYPHGAADIAGYWAEDRILGGVMLFDRSRVWDDDDGDDGEPNVYFQSSRPRGTYLIYQLSDAQQHLLIDFLLSRPSAAPANTPETRQCGDGGGSRMSCPLPLQFDRRHNPRTVDPEFAVVSEKIYRDSCERKPPRRYRNLIRERDVLDPVENPAAGDDELSRLKSIGKS